jgi:carboxylesterase type B
VDLYFGVQMDERRKALAEAIRDYWVQFASTGNPNRNGFPYWPAYDSKNDQLLDLGEKIQVRTAFRKDVCDLFDKLYAPKASKYSQDANLVGKLPR